MAEGWTKDWERRIVNGVYPLRRFLGQSDHSAVFLTEYRGQNIVRAAIKILPVHPALTEAQLARWRTAATLSHPHLIRLLDSGRCQLGGHDFLFVVMDYAEQNLGQILPSRPLTPHEVRDLLPATLDALAYLHGRNLVQGGLKPSNFLVVHDQLKLASDTVRPAGESSGTGVSSVYDPPEATNGSMSPSGDVWALGITLIESLTQIAPTGSREAPDGPPLPATLAPEFVDPVRRCLNRDPGLRPAVAELAAQLQQPPMPTPAPMPTATAAPVTANTMSLRMLAARMSPRTRLSLVAGTLGIIALGAAWTWAHLAHPRTAPEPPSTEIGPVPRGPSPSTASPPAAPGRSKTNAPSLSAVVHEEIPDVPRSARKSVRGVIKIEVRVSVDRSGDVIAAKLEHHSSSRYFDRAATEAAAEWKFAQAQDPAMRAWLLQFEFSRAGATAHAIALR